MLHACPISYSSVWFSYMRLVFHLLELVSRLGCIQISLVFPRFSQLGGGRLTSAAREEHGVVVVHAGGIAGSAMWFQNFADNSPSYWPAFSFWRLVCCTCFGRLVAVLHRVCWCIDFRADRAALHILEFPALDWRACMLQVIMAAVHL